MFKRVCDDCEKYFEPNGKYSRFCEKCKLKPEHRGFRNKNDNNNPQKTL